MNVKTSSATLLYSACCATSHFLLDPPEVRFGFFQDLSHLLLTLRDSEQAGVKGEAVFQPLNHCVYRSFQFGVQHHVLNAPSVLKGRFDGCVGIDGRLAVNHLRRRVSCRRADDRWKPLNASHRVQGKTGTDSIIHPAHFLRGEVSEKFQRPAFVYGKDLLCLNDGWNGEKLVHQQAVGRLGVLFC